MRPHTHTHIAAAGATELDLRNVAAHTFRAVLIQTEGRSIVDWQSKDTVVTTSAALRVAAFFFPPVRSTARVQEPRVT